MSLESFARYPLLFGPSPMQRLDRLTKHLGGATIWAKRRARVVPSWERRSVQVA